MEIFGHPEFRGHEQVVLCTDQASGLRAIIAIHSTRLGPASGGVRMWAYRSEDEAMTDALRLSRAMSYKNALAGLPLGGGKSVIIGDSHTEKDPALLIAFAAHVQRLGGTYWCAEDVGIGLADVEVLGEHCDYVFGLPGHVGDPAPHTAAGVFYGMKAATAHAFGDWIDGLRVAVQGVGSVGYRLCRLLHKEGAELVVADVDEEALARVVDEFGAVVVDPEAIYDADVAIFAPCALGGVLDADTIPRLRARVVAGSANNQLATYEDGIRLHEAGIVYAPDFLVNAGGMLSVGGRIYGEDDPALIPPRIEGLYDQTAELLSKAQEAGLAPSVMALELAKERIAAGPG